MRDLVWSLCGSFRTSQKAQTRGRKSETKEATRQSVIQDFFLGQQSESSKWVAMKKEDRNQLISTVIDHMGYFPRELARILEEQEGD